MGGRVITRLTFVTSLNPYSNGSTTMGPKPATVSASASGLNPYSNGSTTMGLSKQ